MKITKYLIGMVALSSICICHSLRSAENPAELKEAILNFDWSWDNPGNPHWKEIRFTNDGLATIFQDRGKPNVTRWQITSPRTITLVETVNTDFKWYLTFDQRFENFSAIFSFNKKVTPTGKRKVPSPDVVRSSPNGNTNQVTTHKADEPQIKILSEESVNVTAWITSPLDVAVPEQIWENLNFMKEELKDEAAQKPAATPAAYQLGVRLCQKMLENLAERDTATTRAGGNAVLHQKSNLTQYNRDHLTWPQYALERDERAERKENARKADTFMTGHYAVEWNNRTTNMRKEMQALYAQFREALRQPKVAN